MEDQRNPKRRYQILASKILSSSVDYSRGTIYIFPKYCKQCGAGLKKPFRHSPREYKFVFRRGYCSDDCLDKGPLPSRMFPKTVKPHVSGRMKENPVEEMAFLKLEIENQEQSNPFIALVRHAELSFRLLSEKLSFLEESTGEAWHPSKFYFWKSKL